MPRTHIGKKKGNGTATSPDGETQRVAYDIDTYQEQRVIRTQTGTSTLPGLMDIQGFVRPACFLGVNGVVLTMDDGEKMPILVLDASGRIAHG